VIDKASEIAFTALVDLVALLSFGLHDIHAFKAFCDETCKFADCDAAFEGLQKGRSANENLMIAAAKAFFLSSGKLTQHAMRPLLRPFLVRKIWTGAMGRWSLPKRFGKHRHVLSVASSDCFSPHTLQIQADCCGSTAT
jgi:hypothetical protein